MSKLKDMQTPVFWAEEYPGPLSAKEWQVRRSGLTKTWTESWPKYAQVKRWICSPGGTVRQST